MTTATNETPVERRLRKLATPKTAPYMGTRSIAAIDAGREAIAMLRDLLDNYECGGTVDRMISEFLARCGGQEGTLA